MLNVAVCDDMPILSNMIVNLICKYEQGYNIDIHVDSFLSGEDFLNKFNQDVSFYSLIFLDNKMVTLTGGQTAMIIRQSNSYCSIVFITNDIHNYELFLSNPLAILKKPAKQTEVYSILDKVVKKE